jgi:hypothetical protein
MVKYFSAAPLCPTDFNSSQDLLPLSPLSNTKTTQSTTPLTTPSTVTVSGSILQLADDDSTSTLNLEKKRKDRRS